MRRIHPIESESYRILREMVDLSHLGPLSRAVAERVIHASADLDYTESLVLDEAALESGISALRRGESVVTVVAQKVRIVRTARTARPRPPHAATRCLRSTNAHR